MAASQVEVCGQEARKELVSAGGKFRCSYLNLGVTHSHALSSFRRLKIPVKGAMGENLVIV